jgi:hypothetical protein
VDALGGQTSFQVLTTAIQAQLSSAALKQRRRFHNINPKLEEFEEKARIGIGRLPLENAEFRKVCF